jgi:ammonium transporter, Amt family
MNHAQNKIMLGLVAAASLAAYPALAQEAAEAVEAAVNGMTGMDEATLHTIFILNTLLFLIGGFLVFFMACGFCMLEAGLVRSKNVTMQLTKNVGLFSVATIAYYLVGFNLMYPGEFNGWLAFGNLFSPTVLEPVGVAAEAVYDIEYASIGSDFFFQLMFCAATASIVSGALAERIKLVPFLIFTFLITAYIYPIQASWTWGEGWLDEMGFSDFAGSTIVHSVGGWAALAGAIVLGARTGKYGPDGRMNLMPGSNLALATLGMFILWLGWFGFNGGSQLAMGTIGDVADVSRIFANTNAAAAGGALTALVLTMVLYKKSDLTLVLNGALAGLVSITAEPLTPVARHGDADRRGRRRDRGLRGAVPRQAQDRRRGGRDPGAPLRRHLGHDRGGADQPGREPRHPADRHRGDRRLHLRRLADRLAGAEGGHGHPGEPEAEISGLDVAELGMEAYPEFSKAS